jgi:phosphatidylserine decarboxylase
MSDRLAVLPQYLLPKLLLTRFAGAVAGFEGGALTHALIRWFVKRYQVNMAEAAEPDVTQFPTFNAFFTRALKPGVRPLAAADLICPVDGAVSQCGPIHGDRIFQAKGHDYTAQALLGGNGDLARQFHGGQFATIYLSPRDYHRIHMPCDGQLTRMIHVPGELFSVNPTTARGVPGLFARNERVVCLFDTPHGAMALVLVGATIVGSMATVWHGLVNPPRSGQLREWRYDQQPVTLRKGDEMGRFLLGSTVVLLFQREAGVQWPLGWRAARPVQLGEAMASSARPAVAVVKAG